MTETPIAVYTATPCDSSSNTVTWTSLDDIAFALQEGWMVFWQNHQVCLAKISNSTVSWWNIDPLEGDEHFVRLRAFNESQEYHFWKSNGKINGRKRVDVLGGTGSSVVDTSMVLRSVIADPLKANEPAKFGEGTIAVTTRNYIGYNKDFEIPQPQVAGYVDSRFVEFLTL